MDPRQLFVDARQIGICVHCGSPPSTRDHVPSKVLLDEPYPEDLPVVDACLSCNGGLSADETYLACMVECARIGSTSSVERLKVRQLLERAPSLTARLAASATRGGSSIGWIPELSRVGRVVLKLARGHAAYELGEPQLAQPERIWVAPFNTMPERSREAFESVPTESLFPEIGSRAFIKTVIVGERTLLPNGWQIVQDGRYRFLVSFSEGTVVRIVLSEYLACEVSW